MAEYQVTIKTLGPIHLSSGQADVTIDAEIVHDACGLPYFPAKRFKGLLYESALELAEMFALCGEPVVDQPTVDELFQHGVDAGVCLILHDFHLPEHAAMQAELQYLEKKYGELIQPADVLAEYTSVRYQTALDEHGIAARTSLHNMRVVDSGLEFCGSIELLGAAPRHEAALVLALRNLKAAGLKRNRGFGRIVCMIDNKETMDKMVQQALRKEVH